MLCESVKLAKENGRLKEENSQLYEQNRDYALLRKVFGSEIRRDGCQGKGSTEGEAERTNSMRLWSFHRCGGFRHNGMNGDQHNAVIHTDVSVSDSSVKALMRFTASYHFGQFVNSTILGFVVKLLIRWCGSL